MKIFGIAGWSGSGKTTLLLRLIPVLVGRGVVVATIKHTHHIPEIEDPEIRALAMAGAVEVMASSPRRFAQVRSYGEGDEPGLERLVGQISGADLLLVEGYKFSGHPRLEVWDPALGRPMIATDHPSVVAIATDVPSFKADKPVFPRWDVERIAEFILSYKV